MKASDIRDLIRVKPVELDATRRGFPRAMTSLTCARWGAG